MQKELKFTKGPILFPLIKFTIPIFLSMLLQVLYGAVDLIVVGQFSLSSSTSAVATGSQLVHMLLMIISGLCMGTTILLGQKIGAGNSHESSKIVGTTIFLYIFITVIITLIFTIFAKQFAQLINAPQEAFTQTVDYIRISGYGTIFLVAYNVFGAIFRGIGDSKTPLYAVIIATILNILGDLLLVAVFKMGAQGAAIATVFAQAVSVLISIYVVHKRKLPFDFFYKDICYNKKYLRQIVSLGSPIAIQNGLIQISFLAITAIVNVLGLVASAGVGITEKMIGFLMLVQISFGESLAVFSAHNIGASKYTRAKKALKYTLGLSLFFSIIIAWLAYFHGDIILRLFTKDIDVLNASVLYLKAYSFDIVSTSFLFCFIGYFNGFGKTRFTMWQGIIGSVFVRIPLTYIIAQQSFATLFEIGLAIPISSSVQNLMCIVYFIILQKNIQNIDNSICDF